jgi:hypothetical protein
VTSLNLDEPQFRLSAAARATGWHVMTLRDNMAKDGPFEWNENDSRASVRGGRSLLSFRSVVRLGIAFELRALGVSPKDAFWAATRFSDFSSAYGCRCDQPLRLPGHLFPEPHTTYLVFKPTSLVSAQVIEVKSGEQIDMEEIMYDLFNGESGAVAIVDVNRVWDRIMTALDVKA